MEAPLGPVLALASAAAYGTSDFAGGMLSRRRPAVAVVGVSQACSLVVLLAVMAVTGWPQQLDWLPWAMGAGLAGATGLVLFYQALSVGTVGVVSAISATGAAIPALLGILGGERPEALTLAGITVALAGAALASGPELRGEAHGQGRAVLLATGAAVGFGLAVYALSRGSAHSVGATLTGMRCTSVLAFAAAALLLRSVGGVRGRDLPALAVLGLADVGANLLLAAATTQGLLSVTSVLSSLYPVVTLALAAVLLNERMRPVQAAGVIAAITGVVLVAAG